MIDLKYIHSSLRFGSIMWVHIGFSLSSKIAILELNGN
jgi:hypothetical protein